MSARSDRLQAMHDLLQAVSARAVHERTEGARHILTWVAATREKSDEHDPIAALIRIRL